MLWNSLALNYAALCMVHNVFMGSLDRVLLAMSEHLPVHTVIAPRGRLRNMRLEKTLRDGGSNWVEVENAQQYLEAVADLGEKSCCVVAGFSWRIRQEFIDSSRYVINFHPGDLLSCRGPQPLESALCDGHEIIGVSAHLIDSEEMDVGPILARELIDVNTGKGYHWHKQAVNELCFKLGNELFAEIARDELRQPEHWDSAASHWYERPSQETLKRLYSAPSLQRFRQGGLSPLQG